MNTRNQGEGPDRTGLAEDRTILANERTFAGWMRTSLACIAIGLGFHVLFNKMGPAWIPRGIATGFLVLAILVIVLAERRACAVITRLDTHSVSTARRVNLRLFTALVATGALVFILVIWLVPIGVAGAGK